MATSLDTGVPWVMCQQSDAPDPIVSFMLQLVFSHFFFILMFHQKDKKMYLFLRLLTYL